MSSGSRLQETVVTPLLPRTEAFTILGLSGHYAHCVHPRKRARWIVEATDESAGVARAPGGPIRSIPLLENILRHPAECSC